MTDTICEDCLHAAPCSECSVCFCEMRNVCINDLVYDCSMYESLYY